MSFMQNALPFYLVPVLKALDNERVLPLYTAAHAHVFRVICRLTTVRESGTCWMEPEFYGKLVYKHFIVTVPFLFDLISVYSRDNDAQIARILDTVLQLQPKYIQDLKHGLSYLLNVSVCVFRLRVPLNCTKLTSVSAGRHSTSSRRAASRSWPMRPCPRRR